MNADSIINSLDIARKGTFDRAAALNRLRGYLNKSGKQTLHIKKERNNYSFYAAEGRDEDYLSKTSNELYRLARKRYCTLLVAMLEADGEKQQLKFEKIATLLHKFEVANLDLMRIVLTSAQYKWYVSNYPKKPADGAEHILGDEFVRSKSEQTIGLELIELAVPFHYEERFKVYVKPLVDKLAEKIVSGKFGQWEQRGTLFFTTGDSCFWNVPPELQWMNAPGSIWKTYNPETGEITIYPDFRIMLADGDLMLWEHEGLTDDPIYRCNASERIMVLECTRAIEQTNLIKTYEFDTDDKQRLKDLIINRILPRLWW